MTDDTDSKTDLIERLDTDFMDENGELIFRVHWHHKDCAENISAEKIQIPFIDSSNFHLNRYTALRDYLCLKIQEHGGGCAVKCPKHDALEKEITRLRTEISSASTAADKLAEALESLLYNYVDDDGSLDGIFKVLEDYRVRKKEET